MRKTTTIKLDRLSSFLDWGRLVFRDRRETDQSLWTVGPLYRPVSASRMSSISAMLVRSSVIVAWSSSALIS